MPKRTDIKSIMIIGAGPIVIGQACEFDYSGTQACKALKADGYRIILLNSNPATIMTDPNLADATYIEPITPEIVEKIIEKERPDALLPTMGGQTALNTAISVAKKGVLKKYNVELIGADIEAIEKAEDRQKFKDAMLKIGLDVPKSGVANTMEDGWEILDRIGLPVIIRPSFTMGGQGGGIAYNREEFEAIVKSGLDASPVTEVLIEESVLGWKEFEMEVVRDKNDNCIIVCSIENVDPMGVHTGDSITVAPALTLTDKEYQIMRNASIAVLRGIGVETGGSNVQFAINPKDGRMIVIEMNPRVSRSSALASKATGFPIAKIAAKLAVGYTLDELKNDITGGRTPASFEPTIDYVVTKIPRFAFEKFKGAEQYLTTSMKSVGEAMAIGRCFEESLQKALRSLEKGLDGLTPIRSGSKDSAETVKDELLANIANPAEFTFVEEWADQAAIDAHMAIGLAPSAAGARAFTTSRHSGGASGAGSGAGSSAAAGGIGGWIAGWIATGSEPFAFGGAGSRSASAGTSQSWGCRKALVTAPGKLRIGTPCAIFHLTRRAAVMTRRSTSEPWPWNRTTTDSSPSPVSSLGRGSGAFPWGATSARWICGASLGGGAALALGGATGVGGPPPGEGPKPRSSR